MPRIIKHLVVIVLLVLIGGCSSGGCGSGCSSCGITPLSEGFPAEQRIENGASVRVTDTGFQFINDNLGALVSTVLGSGMLTFDVPETSGSQFGIDYAICEGGPNPNGNPPTCSAEIDVGNAQLNVATASPHEIHITGPLPIRLQDLPAHITYFCVPLLGCLDSTIHVVLNGNDACPGSVQDFAQINLDVDISIEVDTDQSHSRYGYSRIKIVNLGIDEDALKNSLHFCGSFDADILEFLKDIIFPLLAQPLLDTLKTQIDDQLCLQANPALSPTCPTGTSDNGDGVCRFADTTCASMVLGADGHIDLSGLLASLSPGTKGGLDFLLAAGGHSQRDDASGYAWGDLNPIAGGATLGFYGGAEPNPISGCVRLSDLPIPTGIPIPDEILANQVDGWPSSLPGPHVGFALSERYANYALNGIYNSGLLCIGISTETIALLNSGTIGLLAASMKDLGLQREQQQIALVVRPGEPPKVTFGNGTNLQTDPLLRITLNNASFDFYMWSLDRFVRVLTATFDLDVPLNLAVTPDGLLPVLDQLGVNNGKVTNSGLLREDPQVIADSLGSLIASQVGQAVGGGIAPIDLAASLASLGLTLDIPESVEGQGSPGLRKLSKGSDNYLGIFATLGIAGSPVNMQAETTAELMQKDVNADGLALITMTRDNAPVARLYMTSPQDDGTRVMEFSYRVDQGMWHPFRRERIVDVQDDWLRVQGRHAIEVRARIAGDPMSLDPTPAVVEVIVDIVAPSIAIEETDDGRVRVSVSDLVSDASRAEARVKLDDGAWSAWRPAGEWDLIDVGEAMTIAVEARDEEGNVGAAEQALIRGRATAAAGGCGCRTAGGPIPGSPAAGLFGIALLGVLARIARREKRAQRPAAKPAKSAPFRTSRRGVAFGIVTMAIAGSWTGCSCGDETKGQVTPSSSCSAPDCRPLDPGLVGAYTSVAVSDGTVWVAGYAEADWNNDQSWGDLVLGKWNGETVDWIAIDGVPSDPPADTKAFDEKGFRGGQTESGEDVGLWTSIAIDASGHPAIAYYDRTNKALRFAETTDNETFTVTTVDCGLGVPTDTDKCSGQTSADVGRYAKLTFLNGAAVIAYLAMEPSSGGAVRSAVRVATRANGAWSSEDAVFNANTPCRKSFCATGTECVIETGVCSAKLADDSCGGKCGSGEACVDIGGGATCAPIYDKSRLDTYPDAVGDYVAIAPDGKGGIGIAYYDRIRGNVGVASKASGSWQAMIVDGEAADGTDTGDMGVGTSLAIDSSGNWHLTYVDGLDETLRYAMLDQGTSVTTIEVADDGLSLDTAKFEDGQHIVGDDSFIFVTSTAVHVSYQDATDGTLRYATKSLGAGPEGWSRKGVDQVGFAGAFSHIIELDGQIEIANWWRVGGQEVRGDVSLSTP